MYKYVFRRILQTIPVLMGVSLIVFSIMHLTPGDPALTILGEEAAPEQVEALREHLGLNDPLHIQYLNFLKNIVKGDLGDSFQTKVPVIDEIWARFPNTLILSILAMIVTVIMAIPLGVISATNQNKPIDHIAMFFALAGVSMPNFWQGMMAILIFSVFWTNKFGYPLFPSSGFDGWKNLVLPVLTIGTSCAGSITRMTRSSLLEELRQDYVRTARAKGLRERTVVYKHALRNSLIPVITATGLQFGFLLGGSVLTETVFSFPGVGRLIVDAIRANDIPMVQGGLLFLAFTFAVINLLVDILYSYVDPRIRAKYK